MKTKLIDFKCVDGWWKVWMLMAFFTLHSSLFTVSAQPKARRQQQQQQTQQQSQNQGLTMRARLMFPTAIDMPEDVVWRRDIYREIDLNKDSNAGLYYPVEPIDKQLNLFTYIFKLALNGYIPVYEYRLDGNELFNKDKKTRTKKPSNDNLNHSKALIMLLII